jgi:hypothetical protein
MMERHARMEERLRDRLAERMGSDPRSDSTPVLLAYVTRALLDTAFNVWYDQRRDDIPALVAELFAGLAEHLPPAAPRGTAGAAGPRGSRRPS